MDQSLPHIAGYTIRAKYLLEDQAARGHEVFVLTGPKQGPVAVDQKIGGVKYLRTHFNRWEKGIASLKGKHIVFGRAIKRRLRELVKTGGFDIIHAHTPFTIALPALKIAHDCSLPFVYEKRNLWEESARCRGKLSGRWPLYQLSKYIDRWVTRRADSVITITENLRQHTIKMGLAPGKVVVVGNGADTKAFIPREPDPNLRTRCLQSGSFIIGYIGTFFKFEGLPLLLETFAQLVKRHPGVRLVLVGDGEDRKNIEVLCRELGVEGKCLLVGKVLHEKIIDYYSIMDVLVYPRYRSTLTEMISPLKPLEPMAMAKVVVVSDVGGMRDLVENNESGLFFEAGSKNSLAEVLSRLVAQPDKALYLGEKAYKYVHEKRQWRDMAVKYEEAYEKIQSKLFPNCA